LRPLSIVKNQHWSCCTSFTFQTLPLCTSPPNQCRKTSPEHAGCFGKRHCSSPQPSVSRDGFLTFARDTPFAPQGNTATPGLGSTGTAGAGAASQLLPAASHQKLLAARTAAHAVVAVWLWLPHKSRSARWRRACRQRRTGPACPLPTRRCPSALRARPGTGHGAGRALACAGALRCAASVWPRRPGQQPAPGFRAWRWEHLASSASSHRALLELVATP